MLDRQGKSAAGDKSPQTRLTFTARTVDVLFAEVICTYLPAPPADVLAIECPEHVESLARAGHAVTLICRTRPSQALQTDDLPSSPSSFDAVVVSHGLSAAAELAALVARLAALVRSTGVILVEDVAVERFDENTARWFFGFQDALARDRRRRVSRQPFGERWADWRAANAGLETGTAMLAALDRHFVGLHEAGVPYLFRGLDLEEAAAQESLLLAERRIQALGLHYVGRPRRFA